MKLLVLAQVPPPVHGQSLAVKALVDHLGAQPDWEIHHVNLPLSRDSSDIGRWRWGKIVSALAACFRVWLVFLRHGSMPIYYVPAPAKRCALYRDWLVLGLCRPFAAKTIFHWHAVGLGEWLDTKARGFERGISKLILGQADLSIAQAEVGRADCERLAPKRWVVIRNGVPNPMADFSPKSSFNRPCNVLFVGLGCREKGLFDAAEAVAIANSATNGAFRFTAVGPFASDSDQREFERVRKGNPAIKHLGFVTDSQRNELLCNADIFCFPSYYPHEGQPAVILEALAYDLPIVATRWRGIPENLPASHVYLVNPRAPSEIAAQLQIALRAGPPHGISRAHYLAHYTKERHHADVTEALAGVMGADGKGKRR